MDPIELTISGIKCDNASCGFRDDAVEFSEYPKYVNKPCTECGHNLLTEQDYKACLRLQAAVDTANRFDAFISKISPVAFAERLYKKFKR